MHLPEISSEGSWPPFPAQHQYSPFFDFIADALFQQRHAAAAVDRFSANRFSRAAVISSALSVECVANCLLFNLNLPPQEFRVADRLSPLDKISRFFKEESLVGFSKGVRTSQRCHELLKIRDAYVHPKNTPNSAVLESLQDAGERWIMPMTIDLQLWPLLGIPRATFSWDAQSSAVALEAAFRFHDYVLRKIQVADRHDLAVLLASRMKVGEKVGLVMPLDDDLIQELRASKEYGLSLDDLGLSNWLA